MLCLVSPQSSYLFNFDPRYIWNHLLLHSRVLSNLIVGSLAANISEFDPFNIQ